jgi:hypothetical protein
MEKRLTTIRDAIVRRDVWLAAVGTVTIILVGGFFGGYNNRVVPVNPAVTARYTSQPGNHLSYLSNWDGPQYLAIAAHGYTSTVTTNFFPLYPLLVHIVNLVVGSPLDSALLVAWFGFFGAVYFYLKIIKQLFGVQDGLEALRGVAFFVFFPTAIFLFATYTEGLFACLALGAIHFALQKRYLPAAALLFFCSAAHITGLFVVALVAMILWEEGVDKAKAVGTAVIGSLGLVAYMTFLWIKFGKPLAFIESQEDHGWLHADHIGLWASANVIDIVFLLLVIGAAIYWWKRRRSFSLYAALFVLIPFLGGQFGGFARYVLMAFPVPWMFYDYLRDKKTMYGVVLILLVVAWTYFLLQYAGGYVGG